MFSTGTIGIGRGYESVGIKANNNLSNITSLNNSKHVNFNVSSI